jgi:16S rRNA C967 or C1407 C5-methylase (RsmB/RsmF family)/NOL1/NOP2/fmu family ribosome biogenesis protein
VQLPQQLLDSLKDTKGFDRETFERVHALQESITSIRLNPIKPGDPRWAKHNSQEATGNEQSVTQVPWTELGFYLSKRPSFTFDPIFHAGCYYVQEASSMFLEQALKQTTDLSQPLKVLDLSAAPGGKSTHIQSLISKESLLVSNDVIRSRANILKDNIIKWGSSNVVVTNNDPRDFAQLGNYFDIIVVDAPCSGSGLFRRDPEAIEEWSENNVELCSQRQQRILADVWPALKDGGVLIYSTCSYSKEEDEDIANWILQQLPTAHSPLLTNSDWGITETDHGYRFWPDKVKGEGFFIACFRKQGEGGGFSAKIKRQPDIATRKEIEAIQPWMQTEGYKFIKHESTVYAWPEALAADFSLLLERLRVIYSGTRAGELMRDKLVPDHALAMSPLVAPAIGRIELDPDQAIAYLQRKDLSLNGTGKGWQLVTYQTRVLGWVNVLVNRVNNYYPKEMRILKDH